MTSVIKKYHNLGLGINWLDMFQKFGLVNSIFAYFLSTFQEIHLILKELGNEIFFIASQKGLSIETFLRNDTGNY